ncbi:hypothetical protein Q5H91_06155 [Sphingomonas sp. KR1UV-12]|uniref:Rap1a immunity protein domain-containing protein n=1 Tax=Sphingomonas aurea TaxID=3063994 RepID=A0ABT9EIJ7_9SPHN|nr:hypothetical protein [Sphingomonas sp. KR1UV-12]MDP1026786.1 hypothetical protein [Sphingomonas sp. KR1UV-12]
MSYPRIPLSAFAIVAAFAIAAPAGAAMTVGTFVQRAQVLREQGFAALLSPDFQVLKEEARQARTELKAENARRIAAHKPGIACVPEGESVGIEEMIDSLAALPAADQRRPLRDGYAKVLGRKFPCR